MRFRRYALLVVLSTLVALALLWLLINVNTPAPPPGVQGDTRGTLPTMEATIAFAEAQQKARVAVDPTPPAGYLVILSGGRPMLIEAVREISKYPSAVEYVTMEGDARYWAGEYLFSKPPLDITRLGSPLISKAAAQHGHRP